MYYGLGETPTRTINVTANSTVDSGGSGPLVLNSVNITSGQTLTLRGINEDTNLLAANLTGAVNINKYDPGYWALTGNNSGWTGTGNLTLNTGVLGLAQNSLGSALFKPGAQYANSAIQAYGGDVSFTNNWTQGSYASVYISGNNSITFSGSVTGQGAWDIRNYLPSGKTMTFSGPIFQTSGNSANTFSVYGTGTTVLSGTLQDGSQNLGLVISTSANQQFGPGMVRIQGTTQNTFTGGFYLSGGIVSVEKTASLTPLGAGSINFNGNAFMQSTLPFTGVDAFSNPLVLFGNSTTATSTVFQSPYAMTFSGSVGNSDASNALYVNGETVSFTGGSFGLTGSTTARTFTIGGTGNTVITGS
ncbi:MAG: hypothetical protein EBS01_04495, partial [Verrucomicrobia bacterium]|nr:hypothetical protein [Verrucomicrobiota bacterium]